MSILKKASMVVAAALLLSACVSSSQDSDIVAEGGTHPECANSFGGQVAADGSLKDNFGGEKPCF